MKKINTVQPGEVVTARLEPTFVLQRLIFLEGAPTIPPGSTMKPTLEALLGMKCVIST